MQNRYDCARFIVRYHIKSSDVVSIYSKQESCLYSDNSSNVSQSDKLIWKGVGYRDIVRTAEKRKRLWSR